MGKHTGTRPSSDETICLAVLLFSAAMLKISTVVILLVAACVLRGSPVALDTSECLQGPKYWCQSWETAKKCGLVELCKIEWQAEGKDIKEIVEKPKPVQPVKVNDAAPVNVTLYFESLCPGCRNFIATQMFPTYLKLAQSGILNIELVPYGNAHERKYHGKWVYICQHGAAECLGNMIETCAIHKIKETALWMPFIHCLEHNGPTEANAKHCAALQKWDYDELKDCIHGEEGNALMHQNALKTQGLKPSHTYVPWLTMNGKHTDEIENGLMDDMLSYVCNAYTGTKPAECSKRIKAERSCFK